MVDWFDYWGLMAHGSGLVKECQAHVVNISSSISMVMMKGGVSAVISLCPSLTF